MKEGWRPKGWRNPWPEGKYLNEDECRRLAEAYEAGAEAVLEAMRAAILLRGVKEDICSFVV